MILLANEDKTRFFLVAEPAQLPAGGLRVGSLDGRFWTVDEAAVAAFSVPEAVAKAYAKQTVAGIEGEVQAVQAQLGVAMAGMQARLEAFGKAAGLQGDPEGWAQQLGLSAGAQPTEAELEGLVSMATELAATLPSVQHSRTDAAAMLAKIDARFGGEDQGGIGALLSRVGDEDDPALKEAVDELAALAAELELDD